MNVTIARLALPLLAGACVRPASHIDLGPVPQGVFVDARVQYYDVSAASLTELRRDMARLGPRWEGRPFQAVTQSRFRWDYQPTQHQSRLCTPGSVKVTVMTVVVFPRWSPTAEPDSATLEWWQQLNAGLMEHERGHATLSVRTAGDLVRTLEGMSPVACDMLPGRVAEAGQQRLLLERRLQASYDADTRHGATQIERVIRLHSP
jgi:predicted secreted Zn-dependent protease